MIFPESSKFKKYLRIFLKKYTAPDTDLFNRTDYCTLTTGNAKPLNIKNNNDQESY